MGAVIGAVSAGIQNDWDKGSMVAGGAFGLISNVTGMGFAGMDSIAGTVAGAATSVGVNQLNRVTAADKVINATNTYLVQPTLYWVNALNNTVIYPAFDLMALPDRLLGYATGTTFEERMAWSAQSPFPADDAVFGALGVVGRLPKVLRGAQKGKLRTRMGDPPSFMIKPQAHHDLPQAPRFQKYWDRAKLDISDPAFGRWVEGGTVGNHQKWSRTFNREWDNFFRRNPRANRDQILEQMNRLRNDPRFQ